MKIDEFHDFEAYAGSLQHLDLRVTLPRRRQSLWKLGQVQFKGMSLRRAYEGSGLIYEGVVQSDAYAIFVVARDPQMLTWNGQSMPEKSVAILKPGTDFVCTSLGTNDWISFVVSREDFAANGHELTTQAQALRIIPDPSNRVRAVLQRVAAAVQANPKFLNEAAAVEALHAELLKMARHVLKIPECEAPLHSGRPILPRKKIIEIALDSMKIDNPASVSVTKLAAAMNLSERTLRSVFHEYFGVGPLRYMKLRQLTSIRTNLRNADPASTTVASIAAEHGIWELGRFAHEYSVLFGERPSETLKSNRG